MQRTLISCNPSDIGPMFGAADLSTLQAQIIDGRAVVWADVPQRAMKAMAGRVDRSLSVGLEGAGTVIEAGDSPEAQALLGRRIALFGEAMYAQVVKARVGNCLPLPAGTSAADGASCFVNPLTALGMVETMRLEGHHALVHTAAASNLGQMLGGKGASGQRPVGGKGVGDTEPWERRHETPADSGAGEAAMLRRRVQDGALLRLLGKMAE